jgi:tetratricopeptide (TPR) repeat protein
MAYQVFLSSTSKDLVAEREAVEQAIRGLDGFVSIAMENFGARADAAAEFDDRKIRECDVVVGLLGLCYGTCPRDGPPSFTEREYNCAKAAGIDRLMLVSPPNFPVPGNLIEGDAQRESQRAFRQRVKEDLIAEVAEAAFTSPAALASAVTKALYHWRVDRMTAELVAAKEGAAREAARATNQQEQAARAAARAAELERAFAEGQKEREALRAAVQALADRAQAPAAPPKVEQALALLPEGRTAEARAVFAEIVQRTEAEGQPKRAEGAAYLREAAEAARHLGALALLEGTEQAIDAYKTATRLDPDDAWSWILLGRLHVQAGSLNDAESAFVQARAAAERAVNERDVMVTHNQLGDVQRDRGELSVAQASYERSMIIARRLAAQTPGNATWQRDLSVSFNKIGDVQRARGDLDAALGAYREGLAIAEKLAAQDLGNAGRQRDLSVSHGLIGIVLERQGDLEGALGQYGKTLEIQKALVAQDPDNAGWQYDLGISQERVGDVLMAQRYLDKALAAYERSHEIIGDLTLQDPGNAIWQRGLSVSFNKIGDVQRARGDLRAALGAYRDSLAIRETLAAQDSGNATWERDVWVSLWKLAQTDGGGVPWTQVLAKMEAMKARGVLLPTDEPLLEEARALAARE